MSYSLTKEQILKEIIKSGKDPAYFINNYAKISHPMRGLIPFKTYDFQTDLINDYNDHRFTVILKARQLGISTITAAYVAWMMMFHRDKNVLVIATKFGTAANLVKKVKAIHRHLPEWMKISTIAIDNRTSFELDNGSQIKASSTSSDAGRSEALSLLVIDGQVCILPCRQEAAASLFLPPTALAIGFTRHVLRPKLQLTIFIWLLCHGMSIQIETSNGLRKKLRTCLAARLRKS